MINGITQIDCSECQGYGLLFHGDNNDYHVEPCQCVADKAGI